MSTKQQENANSKISKTSNLDKVDSTFGNYLNIFHIVNTLTFISLMLAQHNQIIDIFSPSFVKDGFCVSNQDKSVYV